LVLVQLDLSLVLLRHRLRHLPDLFPVMVVLELSVMMLK